MKKIGYTLLMLCVLGIGTTFFVNNVQAASTQIVSFTSFVDELAKRGILTAGNESRARKIVSLIAQFENSDYEEPKMNVEHVEVKLSQLIQNSDRTYNKLEDVSGLLLLVKNVSSEQITLEAKRKCQIVYKIINEEGMEVYDSSDTEKCQTKEKVTFILDAGQTQMFSVRHKMSSYELEAGVYTFEIEYPGYGGGEKEVTIL